MTTEVLQELEQSYRQTFDSDLSLLEVWVHNDGESGLFVNPDGLVYDFATDYGTGESVCALNQSLTSDYNDFALGYLSAQGYNTDALGRLGDEAYGFLLGLNSVRSDAGAIAGKCGRGWEMGSGGKCVRGKGGKGGKVKAGLAAAALGAGALGMATKGGRQEMKTAARTAAQGVGNVGMGVAKVKTGVNSAKAGRQMMGVGLAQGLGPNKEKGQERFVLGSQMAGEGQRMTDMGVAQGVEGVRNIGTAASKVGSAAATSAKTIGKGAVAAVKSVPGSVKQKVSDLKNNVQTIKTKKGKDKPEPKNTKKKEEDKKQSSRTVEVKARSAD